MHGDDGISLFWRELVSLVPTITSCTVLNVAEERYNEKISQHFNTNGSLDGVCLVRQIGGQRFIELNEG